MPSIIKLRGNAVTVNATPSDVGGATLVRCFAASAATVTVAGTHAGSFLMPAAGVEYIEKDSDDTIASSSDLSCTPVAYKA